MGQILRHRVVLPFLLLTTGASCSPSANPPSAVQPPAAPSSLFLQHAEELEAVLLNRSLPLLEFSNRIPSATAMARVEMSSALLPTGSLFVSFQYGDWAHGITYELVFKPSEDRWSLQSATAITYSDVERWREEGKLLEPRWLEGYPLRHAWLESKIEGKAELLLQLEDMTEFMPHNRHWGYVGEVDLHPDSMEEPRLIGILQGTKPY